MTELSKFTGCLLGGAIGDALGAPVEFWSIEEIRRTYGQAGITDYVEHPGNKGEFTDDTQMTLFTAEGMIRADVRGEERGMASYSGVVYNAYLRWLYTQGISLKNNFKVDGWLIQHKELFKRRAPGNTCVTSLDSGTFGTVEEPRNQSKGNGGIMRIAPVGLALRAEYAFDTAMEIAAITHGHPSGYLSSGFFASLIGYLCDGLSLEESIQKGKELLEQRKNHQEVTNSINHALNLYDQTRSANKKHMTEWIEQLGDGNTGEEALSISLFCALHFRNDFEGGVLAAVNHSGDSDSTGSITGNILGVMFSEESIPVKWISNLLCNNIVKEIATDLHSITYLESYNADQWGTKYPGW